MNKNLGRKNYETRDEFYTTKETAEKLYVNIDPKHFSGKSVYCNCDGPESEIYKYWKTRYAKYGLAKLVATKYNRDGNGIKTEFDGKNETVTDLSGNGSYDSEECKEILQQCDIVTTNPPFSKLRDYVPRMIDSGKDMIFIANLMCLKYREILPYSLQKRLLICSDSSGTFKRPNGDIVNHKYIGLSTIDCKQSLRCWGKYTVAELKKMGKFVYADDGILECQYLKYVPVDYYDEIYVSIGILGQKWANDYFDFIGLPKTEVVVNGKKRFTRIVIKRNNREIKD